MITPFPKSDFNSAVFPTEKSSGTGCTLSLRSPRHNSGYTQLFFEKFIYYYNFNIFMVKKKHWLEKFESIRSVVLALYVTIILLIIEGLRFFISLPFKPEIIMNEVWQFVIPWAVAVVVVTIFIKGFSNNLEK